MNRKVQTKLTPTPMGLRTRATDKNSASANETSISPDNEIDTSQVEQEPELSMAAIKALMIGMRDNIKQSTQEMIGELRKDVNEIKDILDKNNSRLEEAENRISTIEDRMQNVEEVNTEVDTLRETMNTAIANYNKDACKARRNNVIVQGLPGTSKDTKVARQTLEKLCLENMKLGKEWVDNMQINETYRFPSKKKGDSWPLFVSFCKLTQREEFYRAAPNLKGTDIRVQNDLAPCLVAEKKRLYIVAQGLQEPPTNYKTRSRDTSMRVWLEIRKPGTEDWEEWEE